MSSRFEREEAYGHQFDQEDIVQRYPDRFGGSRFKIGRKKPKELQFTGIPTVFNCPELGEKHRLKV